MTMKTKAMYARTAPPGVRTPHFASVRAELTVDYRSSRRVDVTGAQVHGQGLG